MCIAGEMDSALAGGQGMDEMFRSRSRGPSTRGSVRSRECAGKGALTRKPGAGNGNGEIYIRRGCPTFVGQARMMTVERNDMEMAMDD